jgi:hypothetical protein
MKTASQALMFAGLLLGIASPAMADILQISATSLVRRCPCGSDPTDNAEVTAGVLQSKQANARYFYSVIFPRDGETVCRFSMVYRDVNANDTMVARLKRKRFAVGGDAFNAPAVMATLTSESGVVDTVRRATTTNIRQGAINTANSFYFLEVEVPTVNLELLGFQIELEPQC